MSPRLHRRGLLKGPRVVCGGPPCSVNHRGTNGAQQSPTQATTAPAPHAPPGKRVLRMAPRPCHPRAVAGRADFDMLGRLLSSFVRGCHISCWGSTRTARRWRYIHSCHSAASPKTGGGVPTADCWVWCHSQRTRLIVSHGRGPAGCDSTTAAGVALWHPASLLSNLLSPLAAYCRVVSPNTGWGSVPHVDCRPRMSGGRTRLPLARPVLPGHSPCVFTIAASTVAGRSGVTQAFH